MSIYTAVQRQHTTELFHLADRLAALGAAVRVYRDHGRDATADALLEEFMSILGRLPQQERDELTLVALARSAPALAMCQRCHHAHTPGSPCPGPTCPTCLRPLPGPLADCDQPECVAVSIAEDMAHVRRADQ